MRKLVLTTFASVDGVMQSPGAPDEYRLWVFPVLLGAGERLFGDGLPPTGLRMVGSRTSESGVVVHTYQPAGPLTFGSFQPGADGRA